MKAKKEKRNKIENKPLLCYTKVPQEKGNLHGGLHRTPPDEEIRIHPFPPRGSREERGGKTDDAIPKTHYTSSRAVFYLGKEPAPRPPTSTPPPWILDFVYENYPLK